MMITSAGPSSARLPTEVRTTFGLTVERGVRLHSDPLVHLVPNLLSAAGCAGLIALAGQRARRLETARRRAAVAWIAAAEDARAASLVADVAALLSVPAAHAERVQFVRYGPGDSYGPHLDTYDANTTAGKACREAHGERLGTALLYLSDVPIGGETFFPALGLEVRPLRGAALIFQICRGVTDVPDPRTIHSGNPIPKGEKWIANLWFHSLPYRE
jgi:prolyl 4-hydroxylase